MGLFSCLLDTRRDLRSSSPKLNHMEVSHRIASSFVNLFLTRGLVGSPWGAGTFAGLDGKRVPSKLELDIAECQGAAFYEAVSRVRWN